MSPLESILTWFVVVISVLTLFGLLHWFANRGRPKVKKEKGGTKVAKEKTKKTEVETIKTLFRIVRKWSLIFFCLASVLIVLSWFLPLPKWEIILSIKKWLWSGLGVSFLGWYLSHALKIITEGERAVILWFKKYLCTYRPGIRIILYPFMEIRFVDIRETQLDIEPQSIITQDKIVATVDTVLNLRVMTEKDEPLKKRELSPAARFLFAVENPLPLLKKLAAAFIRDSVGALTFDKVIEEQHRINDDATKNLCDAAKAWGIKVTRVKLENIQPPMKLVDAMNEMRVAKYLKEATISKAQGEAEAVRLAGRGAAQAARMNVAAVGGPEKFVDIKRAEAIQRGDVLILGEGLLGIPQAAAAVKKVIDLAGKGEGKE